MLRPKYHLSVPKIILSRMNQGRAQLPLLPILIQSASLRYHSWCKIRPFCIGNSADFFAQNKPLGTFNGPIVIPFQFRRFFMFIRNIVTKHQTHLLLRLFVFRWLLFFPTVIIMKSFIQ